jgi:hypothetical protein
METPAHECPHAAACAAAVEHRSRSVFCVARQQRAVISAITRTGPHAPIRFVLWCSLRALEACDEQCLDDASAPAEGGPAPAQ